LSKDSGYYPAQPKKKPVVQKPPTTNAVKALYDFDDDLGEVGEWIEHGAN
jgi:hypothetical protein